MSTYNRWGSHAHSRARLPPTPPEYQSSYLTPISNTDDAFYPAQSRHSYSTRDYDSHGYSRSKQDNGVSDYTMNYPQPLNLPYHYAPISVPILPPIQVPDEISYQTQYQPINDVKMKEEKPTGGVAQHLDYDMDMMANFVAEMCQQMVSRVSSAPTQQFRKYVSQILASTRLPSSTIMLGLFYLQERMKFEKGDLTSSGNLMRMLTVCLLLGSKFLDDNTFQNRSWAEVSNISVSELNSMELKWLIDFNWEIHEMMYDPDQGFFMWVEHWHSYEEKAQFAQVKTSHKLAPINTSIAKMSTITQPLMSPEGPIPPQYQQGPQYDTAWARSHLSEYSPPSTHYSGPSTPEYYPNQWHYTAPAEKFSRASWHQPSTSTYMPSRPQFSPYYAPPQYGQGYHQVAWSPHGPSCTCRGCVKHIPDFYMPHVGYHVQPVVG